MLVTAFNSLAGHARLATGATSAASVHALDEVLGVAALFALGALLTVAFGVRRTVAIPDLSPGADDMTVAELEGRESFADDQDEAGRLAAAATGA